MSINIIRNVDREKLHIGSRLWMTNEISEINEMKRSSDRAFGKCFVGGLGLGIVVKLLAERKEVTTIDVVELQPDVIDMVSPRLSEYSNKIQYFVGDALSFFPNAPYDFIYYDIWTQTTQEIIDICYSVSQKQLVNNGIFEAWELPLYKLNPGVL